MLRDLFSLFPAYAGVILPINVNQVIQTTFPRIRGGDPLMGQNDSTFWALFPAYAGVIL